MDDNHSKRNQGNILLDFSGSTALSGGDINFEKLTGATNATGTITMTFGGNQEARSILIDQFGNAHANNN